MGYKVGSIGIKGRIKTYSYNPKIARPGWHLYLMYTSGYNRMIDQYYLGNTTAPDFSSPVFLSQKDLGRYYNHPTFIGGDIGEYFYGSANFSSSDRRFVRWHSPTRLVEDMVVDQEKNMSTTINQNPTLLYLKRDDGTIIYYIDGYNGKVYQVNASTPWSIDAISPSWGSYAESMNGTFYFKANGAGYWTYNPTSSIYDYNVSPPWNLRGSTSLNRVILYNNNNISYFRHLEYGYDRATNSHFLYSYVTHQTYGTKIFPTAISTSIILNNAGAYVPPYSINSFLLYKMP